MHYVFEKPYALWAFGSGMGYTDFSYSDGSVSVSDDAVTVTVNVTNTGARDGKEVVQLYVSDPVSTVLTPVRQLKAFDKVSLRRWPNSGSRTPTECESLNPANLSLV